MELLIKLNTGLLNIAILTKLLLPFNNIKFNLSVAMKIKVDLKNTQEKMTFNKKLYIF